MSEIEIEGADKHAMEHKIEHGDSLTVRIAILTVMLAIVAVVCNHLGEDMSKEAQELKMEAGQCRTKAGNRWGYFQSKSTKEAVAESIVALTTDAETRRKFTAKMARYETEKAGIQAEATKLDAEADALNGASEAIKKPESRIKLSLPLLQVAIALASITALTRVRWMLWIAVGFALCGIVIAVRAMSLKHAIPDHAGEPRAPEAPGVPAGAHAAK